MISKLNRLEQIRNETNALYAEKQGLEKEIIQHFIDNKENFDSIELDDYIASLKWVYEKHIDYEMMEELYPEIYVMGLLPTFSKRHLLKLVDKEQARLILRECSYSSSHYKVMLKRKRKYRKRAVDSE